MNQNQQPTTVGSFFRTGKILFGAFILGVVNFGIVIVVLFYMGIIPMVEFESDHIIYMITASISFLVLMNYVGNLVFKRKTNNENSELDLSKKLGAYREGKLIQAVTLEASALLALVFVMLSSNIIFVVVAVLSLLQMVRYFPKKSEMIVVLNLSYSDEQKLNDPDHVLN